MTKQADFLSKNDKFIDEFSELCAKYGYTQWFIGVELPKESNEGWGGASNAISVSAVEYLDHMRELIVAALEK